MARLAATSRIAAHRSAIKLDFSISRDRNSVLILCIIVVAVFLSRVVFPIVFGINLIHFFDFLMRRIRMLPEIRSFALLFRSPVTRHLTVRRMQTVSKSATFLATESVNSTLLKRGETKVHIFGKEKCKTHRQFQRY